MSNVEEQDVVYDSVDNGANEYGNEFIETENVKEQDVIYNSVDDGGNEYGNEFTETEHKGFLFYGLVMFICAFALLCWNEYRAVNFYHAVQEGKQNIVKVRSTIINPFNEGKLVYLTGEAKPITQNLRDPDFGVNAFLKIKLSRTYQWYETSKTEKKKTKDVLDGGTTTITTYSYYKRWFGYYVNSSRFERSFGHYNPPWPFHDATFISDVTLGVFDLPKDMIDTFPMDRTPDISFNVNEIPTSTKNSYSGSTKTYGYGFYFVKNRITGVGDTIVKYKAASGGTVSVIAQQSRSTFVPWKAKSGATISRIELGIVSPQAMFENALAESKVLTNILRFFGAVLMMTGIAIILNPLAVASDIIPCVGESVEVAIGIVSFVLAGFLSLFVIGIAWAANRPVFLGVGVAGATVVGCFFYVGVQKKCTRSREMKLDQEDPLDEIGP